jgi:putative membrane protein
MKYLWLSLFFIVLIWSGINPKDQFTWLLEVIPAIIGLVLLASTYCSGRVILATH